MAGVLGFGSSFSELEIRPVVTAASSLTDPDVTTKRGEFYTFKVFSISIIKLQKQADFKKSSKT
jgi:hypothetical protein